MFVTKDRPGALVDVLADFQSSGLNLSHIDKRPSGRENWEYTFFVDVLAHRDADAMQLAIEKAREHCVSLRVVGSYPRTKRPLGLGSTGFRPSSIYDARVIVPLLLALDVGLSPILAERATFAPSQTPRLSTILHTGGDAFSGTMRWQITHLGRVVDGPHVVPVDLEPQTSVEMQFLPEQLPAGDRGFLCEVVLRDEQGVALVHTSGAFEVAEDWTRFPRYGYLTQFNKPADAVALLRPLRDGLINVVQVYDWMDEHHRPWRVGYDYWQDIAARDPWVSRSKLLEVIDVGQDFGMASMAYNLMYGAYENYQSTSPIEPSWGLYRSGGVQDAHPLNIPGWETQSLALFDPGHVGWQDWIAARTAEAFSAMPFDGWHIDTLGDRGAVFDDAGQSIDLASSYTDFLAAMRSALPGQDFSVNAVGDFGGPDLRAQDAWDVAYYELWDHPDQDDYADLRSFLSTHHSASDVCAGGGGLCEL